MMCRLFRIHPSGFHAWLRMPLSKRAFEDKRQIDLLQTAWEAIVNGHKQSRVDELLPWNYA
ncbi:hypothetical protein A6U92_23235 [Agrobacterium rubi]|nr:hypothetical protein A6U92_23235 [Agrobacterium rubi]